MARQGEIPISSWLLNGPLSRWRVLAGQTGVRRRVAGVRIILAPSEVRHIESSDLVFIANLGQFKTDTLRAILERDITALCIAAHEAAGEPLAQLAALCNEHEVPLLAGESPLGDAFVALTQTLVRVDLTMGPLQRFFRVADRGAQSLAMITNEVASLIGNPVHLECHWSQTASPAPSTLAQQLLAAEPVAKEPEPIVGSPVIHGWGFMGLSRFTLIRHEQRELRQAAIPILLAGEQIATIYVWETYIPFTPSVVERSWLLLVQLALAAIMERVRHRTVFELESKHRQLFFDLMAKGEFKSATDVQERAQALGWNLDGRFAVLLIRPAGEAEAPEQRLRAAVESWVARHEEIFMGEHAQSVVLLLRLHAEEARAMKEEAMAVAANLQRTLAAKESLRVVVGIGRGYPTGTQLSDSYREARRALALAAAFASGDSTVHFEDMGVLRLVDLSTVPGEIARIRREILAPLQAYDRDHGTELLPTLQAYFELDGNLNEVAARFKVRYNTALYRIRRIEETIGVQLSNPEDRLNLYVSLKLMQLAGNLDLVGHDAT